MYILFNVDSYILTYKLIKILQFCDKAIFDNKYDIFYIILVY